MNQVRVSLPVLNHHATKDVVRAPQQKPGSLNSVSHHQANSHPLPKVDAPGTDTRDTHLKPQSDAYKAMMRELGLTRFIRD